MNAMAKVIFACKRMARCGNAFLFRAGLGLAVLPLLNCVALGQLSGSAVFSGSSQLSSSSGPPLTYGARTDNCVTGSESGCVAQGGTGQGLTFLLRPSDSPPFAANAPANTAAIDPDFQSYMIMVTDTSTASSTSSFNMKSDGNWDAFSADSSMFMVFSNGGGPFLYYLNPALVRAAEAGGSACSPSNPCVTQSQIKGGAIGAGCSSDCTIINTAGSAVWSRVPGENNVIYELSGDGVTINRLVVNKATDTFTRAQYLQFTSDNPVGCSILPSSYTSTWNGVFTIATDGTIALAEGGGAAWQAQHAYITNDSTSFIYDPGTKDGFQVTVAGTSNSAPPSWASCTTTCTDGGVTWTNIGKLGGQGPGFDVVVYTPGVGCSGLNTRLGQIRRGPGVVYPSGTWQTTDTMICNKYGSNPCPLSDLMTLHDTGANLNSTYLTFSPTTDLTLNTVYSPGVANCMASNTTYYGTYNATQTYSPSSHDTVYDPSHGSPYSFYVAIATTTGHAPPNGTYWAQGDVYCYSYAWVVNSLTINVSTQTGASSHTSGHKAQGYASYWADGDQYQHFYSQPMTYQAVGNPPVISEVPNPGTALLSSPFPSDYHPSYRNTGVTDAPPILNFATDVPTITTGYTQAWYGEITGECNGNGCPIPTVYRFAHEYNTGDNSNFQTQSNIGVTAQDGQWALWGTDVMGTRGSISHSRASGAYAAGALMYPTHNNTGQNDFQTTTGGTAGGTEPNWDASCTTACTDGTITWTNLHASCNQLRASLHPSASTVFAAGSSVYPVTNNTGHSIYSTSAGGTTGGTPPNWDTFCPGFGACPTLDGTVQWVNQGENDCRGDVLLVDLLSAH